MIEYCYLCQSKNLALLSDRGRGNIPLINKVCMDCGLAQRSPLPSREEVEEYYLSGSYLWNPSISLQKGFERSSVKRYPKRKKPRDFIS